MNGTISLAVIEAVLLLALTCALAIGTVFNRKFDFPYASLITFPVGGGIAAVSAVALRDPAAVSMTTMLILGGLMVLMLIWFLGRGAYHFMDSLAMRARNQLLLTLFNFVAACLAGIVCVKLSTAAIEVTQPLIMDDHIISIILLAIFYVALGVLLMAAAVIIGNRLDLKILRRRRQEGLPEDL